MKRVIIILAGGAGTRLQPLSSEDNPKQFLQLFAGKSLFQHTWHRARRIAADENIFVSTVDRYQEKCLEQVPELPPENIIVEPCRRNTAPAVALCTFIAEARRPGCVIGFFPSDHYIANEDDFTGIFVRALEFAESHDYLVTIGITPTEPNTGYGYHDLGDEIAPGVIDLRRFVEKPNKEKAEEFLRAGNFTWNSGMYAWRPAVFRQELQQAAPALAAISVTNYASMPSTSIDYALMEHARHKVTIRGTFGWSDVGSFEALAKIGIDVPDAIRRASSR